MEDEIIKIGNSTIQHGKSNNRIYLQKLDPTETSGVIRTLDQLARKEGYTKIFTKIPVSALPEFLLNEYSVEAFIPKFFKGETDCIVASRFFAESRKVPPAQQLISFLNLMNSENGVIKNDLPNGFILTRLTEPDAIPVTKIFKKVFETYPFPVHDPEYILKNMRSNQAHYFGVWDDNRLIGVSTAETDFDNKNAEMTDFALLPEYRGKKLALHLLRFMEKEMKSAGIRTAYTIARLAEPGMNKTFLNARYKYSGTLINNTNISGKIESMNIFYKFI